MLKRIAAKALVSPSDVYILYNTPSLQGKQCCRKPRLPENALEISRTRKTFVHFMRHSSLLETPERVQCVNDGNSHSNRQHI